MQHNADTATATATDASVGGVDTNTHKDHHVAAVVDPVGRLVASESFRNNSSGHEQLARWLTTHGPLRRVGVEGTGSYGAELTRVLRRTGLEVVEVNRPNRQQRRRHGKTGSGVAGTARPTPSMRSARR